MITVRVQREAFDAAAETGLLAAACPRAGALASFTGLVRSTPAKPITALTLEHYPAMTQQALTHIANDAMVRFALLGCSVIHRVGTLLPGEGIVLVIAASEHRKAALDAVAFLMDWLKTDAPFWKKEHLVDGTESWVEARAADGAARVRWQ